MAQTPLTTGWYVNTISQEEFFLNLCVIRSSMRVTGKPFVVLLAADFFLSRSRSR